MIPKIIGIIIGVLLLSFILVVLIRTLMFTPKDNVEADDERIDFDSDKATENLVKIIQCKTISYRDESQEDSAEFQKLYDLLPKLYPNVYDKCTLTKLKDKAYLFRYEGKSHEKPTVLMSHFDVVPVNEDMWSVDPFGGVIKDGFLYGRGSLDTKVTFANILYACDKMIGEGFVPENDIYMAFSGGEEINGPGAINIIEYFKQNGIKPNFVLDEGGAVVENVFPGVKGKCAVIGIAEKGMMNVKWTCKSNGGHASAPKPHSPITELSEGVRMVESHPTKSHLTPPVKAMYDTLGRKSSFLYRMIFANLWCFSWVIEILCRKQGGNINALMRTTVAFTQMEGSNAANVIPPEASIVTNIRINPDETVESTLEYLKKTINNPNISLEVYDANNPSPISEIDCEQFNRIKGSVESTWKGAIVSPYLMVQCSDSRHYGDISNHVYKFSGYDVSNEDLSTIHGNDERISLEALRRSQEFFIRLVKRS